MKALIVYRSKYGAAGECAKKIGSSLEADCDIVDLKNGQPDPAVYDLVVVGGSIYAGRIQKQIGKYCEKHKTTLQGKFVGYFISCLYTDDKAREELEANFPDWLKAHATVGDWLGGNARLDRMRAIDRFLFVKIAGAANNVEASGSPRASPWHLLSEFKLRLT